MKRRDFFNFVGLGLIATSLPVAIAACSPTETAEIDGAETDSADATAAPATEAAARDDGFAEIGTVAELDEAGFLANESFMGEKVVVVRDPANATAVVAMSSVCTHQGCVVDWQGAEFVCPCHQSKFSAEGAVLKGPATEPLAKYEAMVEGDVVLVKVA
ncbi:MAG: cytochrome B6 [Leptolyngbya foveolarum]|uniref:Cytochrome B6 n=1 Tax=Leptolyngbya foveolarum TaxID=47253 RepID=A0A2W4U2V2_9CYAN|nr:MAG: cytochrome B6 [Leptolyngbya foveolarum]